MSATAVIKGLNLALALTEAASTIMLKLGERQATREAEGRAISQDDLEQLMGEGDVLVALEKVELQKKLAAQQAS